MSWPSVIMKKTAMTAREAEAKHVVLNHFANLQSSWFFGEAQHVNMISTNYTESVVVIVYVIVHDYMAVT